MKDIPKGDMTSRDWAVAWVEATVAQPEATRLVKRIDVLMRRRPSHSLAWFIVTACRHGQIPYLGEDAHTDTPNLGSTP